MTKPEVRSQKKKSQAGGRWRGLARQSTTKAAGRPQGPFKIKKPSQNVRKIGKIMQGKASISAHPGGRFIPKSHRQKDKKSFIFNHISHVPTSQIMSFFTPKNMQFLTYSQRLLIIKTGIPPLNSRLQLFPCRTQHASTNPSIHLFFFVSFPPPHTYINE